MNKNQENLNRKLFKAVDEDDLKGAEIALQNGADANAERPGFLDSHGPLHSTRNPEMVRLLLRARANVDEKGYLVQTLLICLMTTSLRKDAILEISWVWVNQRFAKNPFFETISILLEAGANANLPDCEGRTALFYSTNEETTRLLLAKGAKVDIKDKYGTTALDACVKFDGTVRNAEVMKLLLEAKHKADRKILSLRILQICIGLQTLELPAFVTLAIVDESIANAGEFTMYEKWGPITEVKHFHDEK